MISHRLSIDYNRQIVCEEADCSCRYDTYGSDVILPICDNEHPDEDAYTFSLTSLLTAVNAHQRKHLVCDECGQRGGTHTPSCARRCQAKSHRINCGCCDDVRFHCRLAADHIGDHEYYLQREHIIVRWRYDQGWGPHPGTEAPQFTPRDGADEDSRPSVH